MQGSDENGTRNTFSIEVLIFTQNTRLFKITFIVIYLNLVKRFKFQQCCFLNAQDFCIWRRID